MRFKDGNWETLGSALTIGSADSCSIQVGIDGTVYIMHKDMGDANQAKITFWN